MDKLMVVLLREDGFECDIEEFSDKSLVCHKWDIEMLLVADVLPYA